MTTNRISPEKRFIIAVDLGTSGPKVALTTTDGEIVACTKKNSQLILVPGGGVEQDPEAWWQAIKEAIHQLMAQNTVLADDVVAICCATQWAGTVAVNQAGQHLMNALIWMDSRGASEIKRVFDGPLKIEGYSLPKLLTWLRLTGGIPGQSGKDSIAHILFIKHKFPEIYQTTYKFLEPKDYLNARLTGKFAASFDSISLHWLTDNRDVHRIRYSDRLLRIAGIDREKLPDLKPAVSVLGRIMPSVAAELGLGKQVQVVMGTPDMHAASIGSGAVGDFESHLYLGTSSWLTCHVPYKKADLRHNMTTLPSAIPGRYFVANEQESAGACLTFLRENLLGFQTTGYPAAESKPLPFEILNDMATNAPPGSNAVIFTPWLNGERTPIEDRLARGGFHNLSWHSTREDLVRAVFEGVAYNSKWLLLCVEKFVKKKMRPIHVIGGGANSDLWCQIHADVLNRPILQVKDPVQATVRGAAFLASVALGYLDFQDIPRQIEIANTYQSSPENRSIYDKMFREYLQIYKQNRRIYQRLNRPT